ncbi:MAG: AMP-binding protein, partial [Cellvibrionaceae bacterium]|nr:AMP-binding protein [Cellvibrionaceae bacterium]
MRCFCFSQNAFVGSSEANDRLALIGEDVSYSWFELEQRVNQCRLQIAGFTGDQPRPVVLHGQQEADFIAYILACLELGICYVPVDRSTPVARKQQIKQQLGAGLWVEVSSNQCYHFGEKLLFASDLLGQIAYIVFTSGSTGEPKGVVIPTRGLAHFSQWLKDFEKLQVLAQGPTQSGRRAVYGNMSLFGFDLSMLAWVPALANGQCLVLARRAPQNISEQLKLLAASGLSHWVSTPSLLYQCLLCAEFKPQQLVNLQAFYLCGEALAPTLVKQLKRRFPAARVFNFYGPTEATVAVSALEIDDDILRRYPELLPVGKFDPNIMKINSRAELELKGSSLMLNYLPQLQRDGDAHLSVFASGDEAEQSQGLLFIKQRLDSMVKLNG